MLPLEPIFHPDLFWTDFTKTYNRLQPCFLFVNGLVSIFSFKKKLE